MMLIGWIISPGNRRDLQKNYTRNGRFLLLAHVLSGNRTQPSYEVRFTLPMVSENATDEQKALI